MTIPTTPIDILLVGYGAVGVVMAYELEKVRVARPPKLVARAATSRPQGARLTGLLPPP